MSARFFNLLMLLGIFLLILIAFVWQISFYELPCPFCLLQRFGFLGVAFGLLLNLRFGLRPSHYAVILLSALFTSFAALSQISFHILPGTGAYGSAFFGLHLYTWSYLISMVVIIVTTFTLGIDSQYQTAAANENYSPRLTNILFTFFIFLVLANILTVLLQCGISACPSHPIHYYFFNKVF